MNNIVSLHLMVKFKEIFKVVPSIVMAVFILSVSMGMNVSKMKCDQDGSVYIGTQVPSCSEENEVVCNKEQEKVSCCMKEIKKSCCPETNDKSCASSTQNIHYDFETILTVFELDFSKRTILLSFLNSYDSKSYFVKVNNYFSGIPPPKLNKPQLSQIQSFLL
jgi:negative regulator of genetic competence, sporulation and motility